MSSSCESARCVCGWQEIHNLKFYCEVCYQADLQQYVKIYYVDNIFKYLRYLSSLHRGNGGVVEIVREHGAR